MVNTVLVTGAYGFVGRHVARRMASDGWRVIGLGHGQWSCEEWQLWGVDEWHVADITMETLITYGGNPDVIVHCAGSGSVGFSMTQPYQDFLRTVTTTLSLLEFARIYAPQAKVVYPSSAGVYGDVQKLPITETDPLSPASPYGVHKRIAEELCESFAKNFNQAVAVVRLFSVYGTGLRKQLLWDASQRIMSGETSFFGTGEEVRDWLHVEDAASLLMVAAGHASPECPIVNGGSGKGIKVREIVTELFAYLGRTDVPSFSGVTRLGDPPGYMADISIAQKWGWEPKMERQRALCEYAEWFKRGAL